jgi:hypothetical protein
MEGCRDCDDVAGNPDPPPLVMLLCAGMLALEPTVAGFHLPLPMPALMQAG